MLMFCVSLSLFLLYCSLVFASELIVYKTCNRLFNIILTVFENKLNKNKEFLGALSGELPREETVMNIEAKFNTGRILEFSTRVSILW